MLNQQVRLRARPTGVAQAGDFEIVTVPVEEPREGEILVRNHYLSVEPAMRGWIADAGNYAAQIAIGAPMRALASGEIIASRHPHFHEGDLVTGWFGWQTHALADPAAVVRRIMEPDLPLSASLGVLGINGVTALLALTKIGRPAAGETVVVSTAAGAVGSAVGQIAKILGCRTIGIAGGAGKVEQCRALFRYDAAIDYRAEDVAARLGELCPNGVDIYFDNVAGAISDAVYRHLAQRARIVVCGTASVDSWTPWPTGPRLERHLLVKRARMEGFVIFDHMADYESAVGQLANWVRSGALVYREDILQGIAACPDALAGLYRGENHGKRLIRV